MSENTGPNPESLRRLAGQLPGIVESRKRKAQQTQTETRFRKYCMVCMKGFDKAETDIEAPAEKGICKDCTTMLKDHFAVVCNLEYAFLKPVDGKYQDLVGKIIPFSSKNFEEIKKHHETRQRDASKEN